jgi:hypothetical protein
MDQVFYWLDRGAWLVASQHSWIWAGVTALLALVTLAGIAALARHYDSDRDCLHWASDT